MFIMQRFELDKFLQLIQQQRITYAYIVPPVALALAKHPLVDKYNLTSLRMLHSSAAPTANDLIKTIYNRLKVPLKQGYGLTEASPGVASQSWTTWDKPIGSSGRLIPSMSIKIIDNTSDDNKEVPQGQEGEIWLKGPNIFKGYFNNPKATTDSIDTEGWYRTGDIGYVDLNSNVCITDRVKELIKYNGFQVAPAQLENLLLAHPAVNDVAVIGVYSEEFATELPRAYIVLADNYKNSEKDMTEKELKDWLHPKIAPYKRLRGGVRFVDAVPKSAAGKLLRRVLKEMVQKEEGRVLGKAKL